MPNKLRAIQVRFRSMDCLVFIFKSHFRETRSWSFDRLDAFGDRAILPQSCQVWVLWISGQESCHCEPSYDDTWCVGGWILNPALDIRWRWRSGYDWECHHIIKGSSTIGNVIANHLCYFMCDTTALILIDVTRQSNHVIEIVYWNAFIAHLVLLSLSSQPPHPTSPPTLLKHQHSVTNGTQSEYHIAKLS